MELSLYDMNLVDCVNTNVYNSQPIIKIKGKNDGKHCSQIVVKT